MRRCIAIAAALELTIGCSSSKPGQTLSSYSATFGPVTVPPATERTQCVVVRLGNADKIHVGAIHNTLGTASHHMLVYRVNDTTEQPTPFDCRPFTDTLDPSKGSPLMVTQKKDDVLRLPAGVAYSLDAQQMLRIEMHYINPTSDTVTLTSTTEMEQMADADYQNEGDFLFIGSPDISLPPHQTTTLGPAFFPVPADFADVSFFAITGHEHQLGTNVTVSTSMSKDDSGTPVYAISNWRWNEPATKLHDPTFKIPDGGGFRFSCEWNNTTDQTVKFGESAEAEMCFFWAYYYPSQGAKICFHSEKYSKGSIDICCPGNPICSAAMSHF
jgi:hypothetical protein